jgi:hypothetical protein
MDKAITAGIMAGLSIITMATGFHLPFASEAVTSTAMSVLTPFLVYLIPNKKAA